MQGLARSLHRKGVVDPHQDRSEQLRGSAGPILERLFDKVAQRQDQAPVIPDAHHDVGERDLLYPPPLALHDQYIVLAHRLRQRDLESGQHVRQRLLRSDSGHDADDASRGEQAGTDMPDFREQHQDGRHGKEAHRDVHHFADDVHLGIDLAGAQVVSQRDIEAREHGSLSGRDQLEQHRPQRQDQEDAAGLGNDGAIARWKSEHRQGKDNPQNRDEKPQAPAEQRHEQAIESARGSCRPAPQTCFQYVREPDAEPAQHGEQPHVEHAVHDHAQLLQALVRVESAQDGRRNEIQTVNPDQRVQRPPQCAEDMVPHCLSARCLELWPRLAAHDNPGDAMNDHRCQDETQRCPEIRPRYTAQDRDIRHSS